MTPCDESEAKMKVCPFSFSGNTAKMCSTTQCMAWQSVLGKPERGFCLLIGAGQRQALTPATQPRSRA
jgi:hypothetical protein